MKRVLYLLSASILVFSSCKKSDDTTTPTNFIVLTTGSNWTYQNVNAGVTTTNKLTVKGTDSTINGKPYKVISSSTGPNNYWYNSSTDYFRFGAVQGVSISTSGIDELYLKDIGKDATWTNTFPITYLGTVYNVNASYKATETDITKTVQGKSYTGVTHVTLTLSTAVPLLGSITLGSGDFYYSRGIGLISYAVNNNAIPSFGVAASSQTSELTAYEIK